LQGATGMHVVEIVADDPYAAQEAVVARQEVASVTQLGVRLRVLIPDRHPDPTAIVNSALSAAGLSGEVRSAAASLEDVFVAVTMKDEDRR